MSYTAIFVALLLSLSPASSGADDPTIATLAVPGSPFVALPSKDGAFLFVSVANRNGGGIIAFRDDSGKYVRAGFVSLRNDPAGAALTPDGRTLLVANGGGLALIDVKSLTSGSKSDVRYIDDAGAGMIAVAVDPDGAFAFASEERRAAVAVIDLERSGGPGIVGRVPVDVAPVGLAIDASTSTLYVTSEIAATGRGLCRQGDGPARPGGSLSAIDVSRARTDPVHARIARILIGCSPVRAVLSPKADVVWVTLRGDDSVVGYDAAKVRAGDVTAERARVRVGSAPVGIALAQDGAVAVVLNSARFSAGSSSTADVFSTAAALDGAHGTAGHFSVGSFPREITSSGDGARLFLTNYRSDSVQIIDVKRLRLTSAK